jgi:hypothetical protein
VTSSGCARKSQESRTGGVNDESREPKEKSRAPLRLLSSATGGHVYFPKNTKEFTEAYGEIVQFVRNEYRLEFVPSSEDGKLHALRVEVRPGWNHVNYRQAYFAPDPPSGEPSR